MFENLDDPQKQALLMMAAGLLAPQDRRLGKGGQFAAALSQGMQGGLLGFNQARQAKRRDDVMGQEAQIRAAQVKQMQDAQADQEFKRSLAPQFFQPGNAPGDGMGPAMPPKADVQGFGMALAQRNPDMGLPYLPKPQAPKPAFAPNGQAVDMNDPRILGQNFAAPEKQPDWQNPAWVETQMKLRAAGRPPATQVTTNVLPPREVFKDSLGLKKDFDGQPEVKGFKEVQGAWDQISTALQKPSPANDMAAATKFMKLLDPGSVVRESELMMAMQASGALDRFTNTADRILKGHKLTPEQRKDFYTAGEALYGASKDRYSQTVEQYSGIAKQYGLDDKFIQNAKPRSKPSSGWSIQRVP